MIEIIPLAGMVFSLLLFALIGGFVLLFPLSRRLGALLEQRLQGPRPDEASQADLRQLESVIRSLQEEVERLSERQAFTESLLSDRQQALLPEDRTRA